MNTSAASTRSHGSWRRSDSGHSRPVPTDRRHCGARPIGSCGRETSIPVSRPAIPRKCWPTRPVPQPRSITSRCRRFRPGGQDRLIQFFGNHVVECFDQVLIERGRIRIEQPQQIRVGSRRGRRHVAQGRQVIPGFFQCGVDPQCGVVGLLGFLDAAGLIQDVAQVVMSVGISWPQRDSLSQDGYCLLEQTDFPQSGSQCVECQHVAGALDQGLPALGDGRMRDRRGAAKLRPELLWASGKGTRTVERMPVRRQSAVVFVQIHQRVAELQTGGGVSWVECQGLLEASRCLADLPALGVEHAQRVPVIRAARLDDDRALQGGDRLLRSACLMENRRGCPSRSGRLRARQGAGENRLPNGATPLAFLGKPLRLSF